MVQWRGNATPQRLKSFGWSRSVHGNLLLYSKCDGEVITQSRRVDEAARSDLFPLYVALPRPWGLVCLVFIYGFHEDGYWTVGEYLCLCLLHVTVMRGV